MKTASLLQLYHGEGDERRSIDDLLLTYLDSLGHIEDDALQKNLLQELLHSSVRLGKRVDALLKNTLPPQVAEEIKYKGHYAPRLFEVTILFTDFVDFTRLAEKVGSADLVKTLDSFFTGFDQLIEKFQGTKVKTIGDAYMAVFGAPAEVPGHAAQAIRAGLAIMEFVNTVNRDTQTPFPMRMGIHTGEVIAGVVGKDRMQFDIFGDNVNIAARFESSGLPGRINISQKTCQEAQAHFTFEERGFIALKNKECMEAYFVLGETTCSPNNQGEQQ